MKGTNVSRFNESSLFNFARKAIHFINCKLFNIFIYIVNLFLSKKYKF